MSEKGSPHFVVPDSIEPVLGWKGWTLTGMCRLRSPSFVTAWIPGSPLKADCGQAVPCQETPGERCRCGIYIAGSAYKAAGYGYILGKVYGWGKTVVHETGWRVEHAYPSELFVPAALMDSGEVFRELGEYGVPVIPLDDYDFRILTTPTATEAEWVLERMKRWRVRKT